MGFINSKQNGPGRMTSLKVRTVEAIYLISLLLILFHSALDSSRALASSDLARLTPLFRNASLGPQLYPSNRNLVDEAFQFVPWQLFKRDVFASSHLPIWNPNSLAGNPMLATM